MVIDEIKHKFILPSLFLLVSCFLLASCTFKQWRPEGYQNYNYREKLIQARIETEPQNCKLYVNGKFIGNTPITTSLGYREFDVCSKESLWEILDTGKYQRPVRIIDERCNYVRTAAENVNYEILIHKTGYKPLKTDLVIGPTQRNHFVFVLNPEYQFPIHQQQQQQQQQIIIEKQALSYLSVTSDPSEADVYLDDNLIGTTPFANMKLKPGNFRLKVVKGNKKWERNILLPEDGSLQIKAELK